MPLSKDWKFHHGVLFGIGFHSKMIASQVIVDDAKRIARRRNPTASRHRGWLMYSWRIVLAEMENPLKRNMMKQEAHRPGQADTQIFMFCFQ